MDDPALRHFNSLLTEDECKRLDGLTTPAKIQAYLDEIHYNGDPRNRSPLGVMREGEGHCLDGGLLAALLLRRIGHPARLVDLLPENDDDHILAIYRVGGLWGAVAKSNFANLRLREAIYPDLRTLVYSYFDPYFNVDGVRTLRGYTRPFSLSTWDKAGWMWDEKTADRIEKYIFTLKCVPLIEPEVAARLEPVDSITYKAGLMIANPDGLYRPKH